MNLAALTKAITDRAKADTGSGGLFANPSGLLYPDRISAFYGDLESPTTFGGFPFVVFTLDGTEDHSGFAHDGITLNIEFHIFHTRSADGVDALGQCSTIIDRLRGNWVPSAPSTAPTYGFHRHKLNIVSAGSTFRNPQITASGHQSNHDKDYWHFIETYSAVQTKGD